MHTPKLPHGVRRLFRLPRNRERLVREMDDEIRFHFDMRVAELVADGLSERDAELEAMRRFGDAAEFRAYSEGRAVRQARRSLVLEWLEDWTQDIRYAARQFRKSAGFTAAAVMTLALGMGANTAIFTVVHRVLLAPLPYPSGNRIAMLQMDRGWPPNATVEAWQARARSIATLAAVEVDAMAVMNDEGEDTVHAFITPNYLELLGLHPALGRAFTPADVRSHAAVAMIGYGLWNRAYGGRADVIGQTVRVDDRQYTIVAVAPPDMGLPMQPRFIRHWHEAAAGIWLPARLDSLRGANLYAQLGPGVTAQQATAELQAIVNEGPLVQGKHATVRAMRAQDFLDPREVRAVTMLFAAVGVLLAIACANVANLLMSRAWTRRRELAVRVALGAGRARLARQVLTESVILALAGGILGLGVAWLALRIIVALRPPELQNLAGIHIASTVLWWSGAIAVLTGLLFGCAPALFAGARSAADVLRGEARTGAGNVASRRIRSGLIVFEIAMSLVLLVGAGLLVRSFAALEQIPLGFDPHGLLSVEVIVVPRMPVDAKVAIGRQLLESVRAVPGVTDAAVGTLPDEPYADPEPLETDPDASGRTYRVSGFSPTLVSPNYFRVARMSLQQGRLPDSTGWQTAAGAGQSGMPAEIVINRSLAHRLWPDGHALGARVSTGSTPKSNSYIVVGVVDDIRMPGAHDPVKDARVYQLPIPRIGIMTMLVRVAEPAAIMTPLLRRAVSSTDPRVLFRGVTIGDDNVRDSLAPARFAMALLTAFSIVALVLSGIGLYGVISYSVSQRTREIGIRVALGAEARCVAGLVIGGGLRLTLAGVLLGVVAAIPAARSLASLLYGVSPADPTTVACVALLVGAIAVLASYVPARRALRVDPTEALRAD